MNLAEVGLHIKDKKRYMILPQTLLMNYIIAPLIINFIQMLGMETVKESLLMVLMAMVLSIQVWE